MAEYSFLSLSKTPETEGKTKPEAPHVAVCLTEAGEGISRKTVGLFSEWNDLACE